jgi:hypothetical protein
MKKTLLTICLISSFFLKAQLTEANHTPTSGDVFGTYQCDSLGLTEGPSGSGSVWNYSTINIHTGILNNYTSAVSSNTNNAGYLLVSSSLSNGSYYSSTPSALKYYGGNITAGTVNATLNYSSPAIVAIYPMNLGSTTTNTIAGSGVVTVLGAVTFTGTSSVIADGTGTLVIGSKTFTNAMRLKTTQVLSINGGLANVTLVNFEYYYISKSKRPLLTITSSTLVSALAPASSQSIITIQKDYLTVGVKENSKESIELAVFPNPSNSFINFNTTSLEASKIIAYDVTGKIVLTENFENGKVKLDVSNFIGGIYLYTVIDKNNQTLKSGKFNVTK